ncbi:MAG: efflux RND transporter permease subunit [Patescibacteria group bacterium]|nr:efflux RND transporter permease subunit [Patescibacteria group bacterium]
MADSRKSLNPVPKTSYLQSVEYDQELNRKPWAYYLANIRWVVMFVLLVFIAGATSFANLPIRLSPEVRIPIIRVTTTLPGASPNDVETLVTDPLEAKLSAVDGLSKITSFSQDSISIITLEFSSSVDREQARQDTQSIVDSVTGLPEDAETPRVTALDFEDAPIWQFALIGTNEPGPALFTFARDLQKILESSSRIDRVLINGDEPQEIQVTIRPEKARELGINPVSLMMSVRAATASFPAGTVKSGSSAFSLAVDTQITSVQDLRNLRVSVKDTVVRLGEIAEVAERSADSSARSFYATPDGSPKRTVVFSVYKTSSSNIDDAAEEAERIVAEKIAPFKNSFEVRSISSTANDITDQFSELLINFRDTIILVFLVLIAFLGFRQALIACFTIPLTFLATFGFMQAFNLSINFLSLFSLLLSLGLLIDDTVVIVQAMTAYYATGRFTPQQTGLLVWRDFIIPIWSTTITTVWAFAPLLLASGIIGEFIKSIPLVVSFTLISSTAIAVLVTLPLMIFLLKPEIPQRVKIFFRIVVGVAFIAAIVALSPGNNFLPLIVLGFGGLYLVLRIAGAQIRERFTASIPYTARGRKLFQGLSKKIKHGLSHGFIDMGPLDNFYKQAISKIVGSKLRRRTVLIMVAIFTVFSYLLVPLGFVQNEFFPKSDNDQIFVNLELPSGTTIEQTNTATIAMIQLLQDTPELAYLTGTAGQFFSRGAGSVGRAGSNTASFTLNLRKDRKLSSIEVAAELRRKFALYDKGTVTVVEVSGGPPAGSDIQIKLLGDDLQILDSYANRIADYLKSIEGVQNIEKSLKPGASKLVFVPDYTMLAEEGLSSADVGQQLRTFASGLTLDSITVGDEERNIVFRYENKTPSPEDLSGFTITTKNGSVPLTALGAIQLKTNPTRIDRENGKRTISVSADTAAGYNNVKINSTLEEFAATLNLPPGYRWETGGVNEENARSVRSILQAMVLAFILIFGTMVIQFGSFRQALLVLLVIPLAISGVFIVFAATGTPLSFPALIGILALFGIVVNNSMVIIDKINMNRREGLGFVDAIADAAANRLEPIVLTSLLTMIGLIPITLSDPLWQGLGGAIISGLMFSGLIMLFFIPVVYYVWFRRGADQISS